MYLCPAPLYHSAPLVYSMSMQRLGATVVLMERFDPRLSLELIERHRVTHAQFVPTMFVRMLRLPEEERARYDLSSLELVLHAAAPCLVPVKRQMLDWRGRSSMSTTRAPRTSAAPTSRPRSGWPIPARWAGRSTSATSSAPTARSCRPISRVSCTSPAGARSSTTTTPPRRRRSPTNKDGGRSATSATSTRTATST